MNAAIKLTRLVGRDRHGSAFIAGGEHATSNFLLSLATLPLPSNLHKHELAVLRLGFGAGRCLFRSSSLLSLAKPPQEQRPRGFAAKASAAGARGASAHHAHRTLATKVAGKVINKASDELVDSAVSKAEAAMANRKKNKKDR